MRSFFGSVQLKNATANQSPATGESTLMVFGVESVLRISSYRVGRLILRNDFGRGTPSGLITGYAPGFMYIDTLRGSQLLATKKDDISYFISLYP